MKDEKKPFNEKLHESLPAWSAPQLVSLGHESTEVGKRRRRSERTRRGRVRGPSWFAVPLGL